MLVLLPAAGGWASEKKQDSATRQMQPPPRPPELKRPSPPPEPAAAPARAAPDKEQVEARRGRENPAAVAACFVELQALYGKGIRRLEKPDPAARDPSCQVVDPVVVEALTTGSTTIAFEPPVTLSCEMATRAAGWLTGGVQPLARGVFGRELVGLRVGGGHECRRRNRAVAGQLSEHATGRALDIFAFVLAGPKEGSLVSVERPDDDAQRRYLLAVRQLGCGAFSTSLGPGADAEHANHLHVDIQWRRAAASKFCQ